ELGTGISSQAQPGGSGTAGDIKITATSNLKVHNGALIDTTTHGKGDAGDLTIKTDYLDLYNNSFISTITLGSGAGGNIIINASKIAIREHSVLGASTAGIGQSGDVTLVANNINVSDNASVQSGSGFGDLDIPSDPDLAGSSGDILITFNDTLRLKNNGRITTVSEKANAGNITINNGKFIHLSNESGITTRVLNSRGKGGNIFISTPVVGLNSSVIGAQAKEGQGGNINISGSLLQSPNSMVTASSELGVDGEITLQPATNINASIAMLPDTLMNTSQHLSERCVARSENNLSSFVVKGRGVLPITPDDMAPSKYLNNLQPEENLLQDNKSKVDTDHHSLDNIDSSLYSSLEKKYQSETMNNDCNP
ncbi:MAG: hypothetical protein V3V18_12605, partial [Methylococcales bacterium]